VTSAQVILGGREEEEEEEEEEEICPASLRFEYDVKNAIRLLPNNVCLAVLFIT
jgi:hypothetical protein